MNRGFHERIRQADVVFLDTNAFDVRIPISDSYYYKLDQLVGQYSINGYADLLDYAHEESNSIFSQLQQLARNKKVFLVNNQRNELIHGRHVYWAKLGIFAPKSLEQAVLQSQYDVLRLGGTLPSASLTKSYPLVRGGVADIAKHAEDAPWITSSTEKLTDVDKNFIATTLAYAADMKNQRVAAVSPDKGIIWVFKNHRYVLNGRSQGIHLIAAEDIHLKQVYVDKN